MQVTSRNLADHLSFRTFIFTFNIKGCSILKRYRSVRLHSRSQQLNFSNMFFLHLSVTETMAVDSMLPSPSSISNPMSGFEGLPGKRRKKRTSIETNVRVILERNFNTVQIWLLMSNSKNIYIFYVWHSY